MHRFLLLSLLLGGVACRPAPPPRPASPPPPGWNGAPGWNNAPPPAPAPAPPPPVFNPLAWIPLLLQPFPMPAPGAPAPAPAGVPAPAPAGVLPSEQEVLALVNVHRQQGAVCGGRAFGPAPPLAFDPYLHRAARAHSQDMANRQFFDHTTPEGRTVADRLRAAGFRGNAYGENIAAGNETASATVAQWMRSTGHCENIMDPQFRLLGVGYGANPASPYTHYWTQNFGG